MIGVFPGQGSQTPGFLEPWLEIDGARERLAQFSEWSEVDLLEAGTVSDADTIRDTRIAQPLIVAASLLSWELFAGHSTGVIDGVAGHSVGEFAALAAAGVLSTEDALRLVGIRGRAMADAAAAVQTGMSAVIGGDQDLVLAALAEHDLTPANFNGGGQIVAAGATENIAAFAASPPAGTRVIPLSVAGAFHTRFMAPAVETLRTAAATRTASDPQRTLWTNRDGSVVTSGSGALDLAVDQVASPVRWDSCMAAFAEAGVAGIVEFAPAGTLVGLAKRALRGVPSVAIKTPDDFSAADHLLTGERA
ncbi:ACP S-malonyltransferase [Microbacterium sediminicola]|uniref:[acyl-carrier-protein] S-malonyltransferase n=2 Tax=Microbacterium sediminicola TaxID=415210 RepID=A0ABN2HT81_9MICO